MEKLYTVKELAQRFSVAPGSIYHWISEGRLPVLRFSKRCVRFSETDLQALFEQLRRSDHDSNRRG